MAVSVIEMRGISVAYPGVQALADVDFFIRSGGAHALVGANGAGKSTLMGVLSGANADYTGEILLDGRPVEIRTPADAKRYGIETVFQEVDATLVPGLSVAENIMLDALAGMRGRQFIHWRALYAQAERVLVRLGRPLPLHARVETLPLAQKQMVLIARALAGNRRFLVLDEPTAPLSVSETETLFAVLRDLKKHDVGIVFISHRLPELFEICEDITVLRDGRLVATQPVSRISQPELVRQMLGETRYAGFVRTHRPPAGAYALEAEHLSDGERVKDVSLRVGKGEIVGLAGLVGAGKTELLRALFGAHKVQHGTLRLHGQPVRFAAPAQAVRRGLALIPEERRKEGVLIQASVGENLSVTRLGRFSRLGFLPDFPGLQKAARETVQALGIRTPGLEQPLRKLSGGNQQKVAVGKWLDERVQVFLFDEPTKGIDIGAKQEMFAIMERLAAGGAAVLYATCELAELLAVADRIYVMYDGRVVHELPAAEADEETLLFYATGGRRP